MLRTQLIKKSLKITNFNTFACKLLLIDNALDNKTFSKL